MILPPRPALLATLAGLAAVLSAPAIAADMTLRGAVAAEPLEAARTDWSGAALGVQGGVSGGAQSRLDVTSSAAQLPSQRDLGDLSLRGGFAGLRASYDIQSPFSSVVAGVAADLNFDGLRRSVDVVSPSGVAVHAAARAQWDAALRLRLGFAYDRLLIYATGGAALAREKLRLSAANATAQTDILASKSFLGATLGVGAEYALARNLTLGAEYRYTWFGDKTLVGDVRAALTSAGTAQTQLAPDFHRFAATLNMRF